MKKKLSKQQKILIIIISGIALLSAGISGYFILFKKDKALIDDPGTSIVDDKEETKKLQIIDENSKSRPYAIMINNISTARPLQSGLQDAYLIYEIIVEGGISRYMALFKDASTARIGSIRSSRHYFLDYSLENDAIYVHHGQSTQAKEDFTKLKIDRIEVSENKTGWRDKTLNVSTEHTLFTNIELLNSGLANKRTETNKKILFNYSIEPIDLSKKENAKIANNISIPYSKTINNTYVYDSTNGYYLRSVNGKAHTDYVTKNQYHFKNIITYKVKNYTLNDPENKGRQGLENIGSGEGYFITNGYAIPINWKKTSRESQTIYTYKDGTQININDGNTFIQIQPTGQELTIGA